MADLFGSGLYDQFRHLQQEMDDLFGRWPASTGIRSAVRGAYPPVNVGSTPDAVDVYVFAAGLDSKSVDLTIEKNLLTVSGKREVPVNDGAQYYRRERFSGEFRRVITLPDEVDPERANASYRDGILRITVPRLESARPRQIQIQ
jgi:HSP20 family protein